MKAFFRWITLFLFLSINAFSQSATIHIAVKNFSGSIKVDNPELHTVITKNNAAELPLNTHQPASYTTSINKPTFIALYFKSDRTFSYVLFLSPGDELFLTINVTPGKNDVAVTGKGSNNNQPSIFALTNNMNLLQFKNDATPYRVIAAINKQFLINKSILTNYIKANKPSTAFIKTAMANLQYFAPLNYYLSSHNNIYGKPEKQLPEWQRIQDSLFLTAKLCNDNALTAYNYTQLIRRFITVESYKRWMEYDSHPAQFFKHWFHTDITGGKKFFINQPKLGILFKLLIDKYFTRKVSEYAYCEVLKKEYNESDYPSTVFLFNHFKKKYPNSAYIKYFSPLIAEVIDKQRQAELNGKTVFVKKNGTNLNTFENVLALAKGKTALIDMWGTWCGPCREEIEKNAKKLRTHFKGKDVTFLYIANRDIQNEKEWKKQIAYFQIEGTHILANPKLTADIMKKVKATGYPTYIIVKKDGSYKQSSTQYPVNLQAMMKEIEDAAL